MADLFTYVYDPKKVTVTIGELEDVPGLSIKTHTITGFAEGTFVTAEKNEDKYTMVSGGQEETTRVVHGNNQGTVTVTLKHTSPSNSVLAKVANSDEVVSVWVNDLNTDGPMLAGGNEGWLQKPAAQSRGNSVENITWTFSIAKYGQQQ